MKIEFFSKPITTLLAAAIFTGCGGGGGESKPTVPENKPPVIAEMTADAIFEQSSFEIVASASDSDGSITSYNWQQTAGTDVSDLVTDAENLSFTAPDISTNEVLTFTLTVSDNVNATASLNLDISVIANVAPVITEMTIASVKERAHLNFSPEVTDIEEQEISYQWIQTAGTPVVITEPALSTLSFDAPSISEDETITFSLTVTDTYNDSTTAEVDIALSAFEEIQISDITDNGLAKCLVNDSAADMGLTKITCDEVKIESLGDLNNFPLLTEVSITNANIIDISALTDIPQLTKLN